MSSSDGKGRRHDVMEMEIKFKGKTEQLTIHFGDDPYAVALDFVNRNNLKPSSVKVIAQYIENTMKEFLSSADGQDSPSPGQSPSNVPAQDSMLPSIPAGAAPQPPSLPAPFPPIVAAPLPPPASAAPESFSQAGGAANFQPNGGAFISPSNSRAPPVQQSPLSASGVKLDMVSPSQPATAQAYSSSVSPSRPSQSHPDTPGAPFLPSSVSKDAPTLTSSSAASIPTPSTGPVTDHPLPTAHRRHRHSHHQPSVGSTPAIAEEKEDVVNVSRGSSTTTIPTNLAHVTTSYSAERALSGIEVHRSRDLSPPRSITPERDTRGSFSLSTSRKGVEYEITRYRSDSLNYSTNSAATLSGWNASATGGAGGEAGALSPTYQQSAEEKDVDFEAYASEDDGLFSIPAGLNAPERTDTSLSGSSLERRQTRRESYQLPRDTDRKMRSSNEEDLTPYDDDPQPPIEEDYPEEMDDQPAPTEEEMYNNLKTTVFQSQPQSSLKPSSHVMMMGKHKFSNLNTASGVKASQGKSAPSMVNKSAHERLYINANVMKKKKEMIYQQQQVQAQKEIQAQQYRINRSSQRIVQSVFPHALAQDYDVTKKLYEEGLKAKEKKEVASQRVQEVRSRYIYDWSCVQCGELASIPYSMLNSETRQQVLEKLYICKRCNYDNYAFVYSQVKRPVNIGLMYNQEAGMHLEAKRMVTMEDEGRELPATENIHEYLYLAGRTQDKILKLNKMLYEEMQTNLPFRPQIPLSSKQIVEKNIQQAGEEDSQEIHPFDEKDVATEKNALAQPSVASTAVSSAAGWKTATESVSEARLTGQKMKNYFSKPLTTRLNTTYTKAQVIGHRQSTEKKPPIPKVMGKKEAAFVARLLGEVQEKEKRQTEAENEKFSRDPHTQQELFKPKVEPPPQEIYGSSSEVVRLDPQTGKPMPIWEKLVAKNEKLRERKQKAELAAMNKLLGNIQSQQVKALESSNTILESSFNKNISELFKLLLVSNMIYHNASMWINGHGLFEHPEADHKAAVSGNGTGTTMTSSSSSSSSPALPPNTTSLPDAEELFRFAQAQEDFESKQVDLMAIDRRILINEVSTLLLDMQHVYVRRVQQQKAAQAKGKHSAQYSTTFSPAQRGQQGADQSTRGGLDPSISAINPAERSGLTTSIVADLDSFDAPLTSFLQSSDGPMFSQSSLPPASAASLPAIASSSLSSYMEDAPQDCAPTSYGTSSSTLTTSQLGTPSEAVSDHRLRALHVCDLIGETNETTPETLLISYPTFVKLAKYCMKRRNGPGTGYLFAPKKKPILALQKKELEDSNFTFVPSLDRNSVEILRSHGNSRSLYLKEEDGREGLPEDAGDAHRPKSRHAPPVPIEQVLLADGERVQTKIESMRQKRIYKDAEELTFKPFLYKPPKNVKPKYKGVNAEDEEDDDHPGSVVAGSVSASIKAVTSAEVCFDDPSEALAPLGPQAAAIATATAARNPSPIVVATPSVISAVDISGKASGKWQTSEQLRKERYLKYTSHAGSDSLTTQRTDSTPTPTLDPASTNASATALPGMTAGGSGREGSHGAHPGAHPQDTGQHALQERSMGRLSPLTPSPRPLGANVQSPHVAMEDIYNGFDFDETLHKGDDEDVSVATPYTKSTISTKFSIDMPADQQHQQHDHMFKDVTPYIAQEQPLQAAHTNAIPSHGHASGHNASHGNLKNARSLASFSLKHSLSYSSCNSSVGSGSGHGVRATRANTINSGFVSSNRSDSDESSSFRSGGVGGESSAAGAGRAGGGSREGLGGAGRASSHHRSGHVVRKVITTKPSMSSVSIGKSHGPHPGSLPLLPEELHQMHLAGSARSLTISQGSPSAQGTVSGLDDSSLFSVSTASTVVKKKA